MIFTLFGCKKKEEESNYTIYVVTMGSDLYSSETEKGVKLISNITSFLNLEISVNQVKKVGFVYNIGNIEFSERDSYVKDLSISDDNVVVETTLLPNHSFEYVINIKEEDYKSTFNFRSYIIYDDNGVEKVFYSFNVDGFIPYELALQDNSVYAREIIEYCDGPEDNPPVDPPVDPPIEDEEKTLLIKPNYSKTPYEFEVDGTEKDYCEVSLTSDSGYNYIYVEISGKDDYVIPDDLVLKIIVKYKSEEYATIDLQKCTKEDGKLKYKYNDPCWSPLY